MERELLVGDAGTLVREADRVACVEDGDDGLDEVRMNEVLYHLADDREGDATALLLCEPRDGCCDLLEVGPDVGRLDHHDAWCRSCVVIDGDTRWEAHLKLRTHL